MKIRSKITAALMLTAAFVAIPLTAALVWQEHRLAGSVAADSRKRMLGDMSDAVEGLSRLCATHESIRGELLGSALRMAHDLVHRAGPVQLGKGQVGWTATDQRSKAERKLELPEFVVGGRAVTPGDANDVGASLIDQTQQIAGVSSTIFQRMSPDGDMLRIATSMRRPDGSRAVGTFISRESPVVQAVLRGQTYKGRARVVDEWYLTAYEPIRAGDEIVGMLYVGLPEKKVLADVLAAFAETKVGRNGYAYIMSAHAEERGVMVYHPDPQLGGKAGLQQTDADAKPLGARTLDEAIKGDGKVVTYTYPFIDPRGERRDKVAAAIYFKPLEWVIAATADQADFLTGATQVDAAILSTEKLFGGITLAALLITGLVAWPFARAMTRPLHAASDLLQNMAAGDLSRSIEITSNDEVAEMTSALNGMRGQLSSSMLQIGDHAQSVAAASERLATTSREMRSNAELTSEQARVVSDASTQVSRSIQTVATGTEQISVAVREISKSASESAQVVSNAVEIAKSTDATISKLSASSEEIGKVVNVITSIAEQTNLLALNATIEAAHAGDAGKGFAVVASEVRDLAKETARATKEISRQVSAIQLDARGAVDAIAQIRNVIQQIYDLSGLIASAVEEQAATTNEISHNIADAARGSTEITQSIQQVAETAEGTLNGADHSSVAAAELARAAAQLQELVGRFQLDDQDGPAPTPMRPQTLHAPDRMRNGLREGVGSAAAT